MKLDARRPLIVLQGLFASAWLKLTLVTLLTLTLLILLTLALQELKDGLLDDTAWPVVMQWFNEDH